MLVKELELLIHDIKQNKYETNYIELRKPFDGTPKRLYDTLSSFSNQTGGGIIIFGIDENNDYNIAGVYDVQDLQQKVTEQSLQMEPVVRPLFTVAKIENKYVVSAEIAECDLYDKPCYYKGSGKFKGSFIRVGDADLPMTEYEIYSYEVFKRKIQDELRIVDRASLNDFNAPFLKEYLSRLYQEKPNLVNLNEEDLLRTLGVIENGKPTVAGLLLFGQYPQAYFPQLSITAVVVPGTIYGETGELSERFVDNKRIEGTLSQMLDGALIFIRRNMKTKTIIDDLGNRKDQNEYPIKALREILLNALIHRDYSIHTDHSPIRIIMFSDRIEVENPGSLYGRISLDELGKVAADTRNPFIARALEVMRLTENRFSGIPTIYHEMKKAGLTEPEFINSRGFFKVVLYNKEKSSLDYGIHEKIINFCNIPRSRDELAKEFNFSTTKYFINTYVIPLVEKGLLKLTIPDKPKSKNQKYVKS